MKKNTNRLAKKTTEELFRIVNLALQEAMSDSLSQKIDEFEAYYEELSKTLNETIMNTLNETVNDVMNEITIRDKGEDDELIDTIYENLFYTTDDLLLETRYHLREFYIKMWDEVRESLDETMDKWRKN